MTDATLKQRADSLHNTIQRDLASFEARNITQQNLDVLETLAETFGSMPTDEELMGAVIEAVAAKNKMATQLRERVRIIRNMAEQQYGKKGLYTTFAFENMSHMTDEELYRLGKRVARLGTRLMKDLAAQGLTNAMIDDLTTTTGAFDEAINDAGAASENRQMETLDRIAGGNELWAAMVHLGSVGRSIFVDTDEARYNDYILTDN